MSSDLGMKVCAASDTAAYHPDLSRAPNEKRGDRRPPRFAAPYEGAHAPVVRSASNYFCLQVVA